MIRSTATRLLSSRVPFPSRCIIFRSYGIRQESNQWKQKPNRNPRLTLILSEDIPTLGSKGEMIHVKRGYGRNYLLPKGKAVYATQDNMKLYNTVEKRLFIPKRGTSKVKITNKNTASIEFLISFLKDKKITIEQDETQEEWRIYEFQVAAALRKQWQCHAPLDCISFPNLINSFGTSDVILTINNEMQISIPLDVVPSPVEKRKPIQEQMPQEKIVSSAS